VALISGGCGLPLPWSISRPMAASGRFEHSSSLKIGRNGLLLSVQDRNQAGPGGVLLHPTQSGSSQTGKAAAQRQGSAAAVEERSDETDVG